MESRSDMYAYSSISEERSEAPPTYDRYEHAISDRILGVRTKGRDALTLWDRAG